MFDLSVVCFRMLLLFCAFFMKFLLLELDNYEKGYIFCFIERSGIAQR